MGWIKTISDAINQAFGAIRPPLKAVPSILLLCEINKRPGISAIALTSAIIRRLPEVGIPTGVNVDGSPNMVLGMVKIMSEEIVREFKDNARIDSVISSNSLVVRATGGNAGGPFEAFGTNILNAVIKGILR